MNAKNEAIKALEANGKTAEQRARIYRLLKMRPRKMGWTNREIANELNTHPNHRLKISGGINNHIDHSTVAARRNELAKKGVIEVSEDIRHHQLPDGHSFPRAHYVWLA